ncbi:hypothetical protein IJI00_00380 [Candidatus Saccharibacteria bacterium]|nr:hypothetical protein [Candidatus Saccharibacteria bacterium]
MVDIYKTLEKSLKHHAKGLRLPPGAANAFIDETLVTVQKSLRTKSLITDADLKRITAKTRKKYKQDVAYVYENYDIIL